MDEEEFAINFNWDKIPDYGEAEKSMKSIKKEKEVQDWLSDYAIKQTKDAVKGSRYGDIIFIGWCMKLTIKNKIINIFQIYEDFPNSNRLNMDDFPLSSSAPFKGIMRLIITSPDELKYASAHNDEVYNEILSHGDMELIHWTDRGMALYKQYFCKSAPEGHKSMFEEIDIIFEKIYNQAKISSNALKECAHNGNAYGVQEFNAELNFCMEISKDIFGGDSVYFDKLKQLKNNTLVSGNDVVEIEMSTTTRLKPAACNWRVTS